MDAVGRAMNPLKSDVITAGVAVTVLVGDLLDAQLPRTKTRGRTMHLL
jgi:hypothetical protein